MALTKIKSSNITTANLNVDSGTLFVDTGNNSVGIGSTTPNQYTTSGRVVTINGSANDNTGPAVIRMNGRTTAGRGFVETEVFGVTGVTTAAEITRLTGTGANGFRMLIQIVVCGHTGSVGNGHLIGWYHWDGGTESVVTISEDVEPYNDPVVSFDTSTSNVCIVKLASATGSNPFQGVMEVKFYVPIDFAGSTYTTS